MGLEFYWDYPPDGLPVDVARAGTWIRMTAVHILGGIALLVITGYLVLCPAGNRESTDLADHLTAVTVLFGLVWALVVFSGFFQLGSTGSIAMPLLRKLGAMFLGGILVVTGTVGMAGGNWSRLPFLVLQSIAFLLFLYALVEALFVL